MDNSKPQNRLNAVRHGLLPKSVILSQDDVRPFNKPSVKGYGRIGAGNSFRSLASGANREFTIGG